MKILNSLFIGKPVIVAAVCLLACLSASAQHTLVAHYNFDNSTFRGQDSSTNHNDILCGSFWGTNHVFSTNAEAGGGALQFFGFSDIYPCTDDPPYVHLSNALSGSFSISVWIKTTRTVGSDTDGLSEFTGQCIVLAHANGSGVIPIGITGSKAAFFTDGAVPNTTHSQTSVTTGAYTQIVVTYDSTSGQKEIYVNGALDGVGVGTSEPPSGDIQIGGFVNSSYAGLLDDMQIYSGVLNSAEVGYLFQNPGLEAPDIAIGNGGLVAHYTFDDSGNIGTDASGNGNDMTYLGGFNGGGFAFNTNAVAGGGAVKFDSNGGIGGGVLSWNSTPTNLLNALAGSFTVSCWVKTTQSVGSYGDNAYGGAGIVAADVPGLANDVVPLALTGGEVAINIGDNTGDNFNGDYTADSDPTVNDGTYHQIAVTRLQATGEVDIYIDGVADINNPWFAGTNLLNDPKLIAVGAVGNASASDPPHSYYNNGYDGLLDDLQIYSRALSASEILHLYQHPGQTITVPSTIALLEAHYTFDNTNDFTSLWHDDSGNGNNIVTETTFGGGFPVSTPDGVSGPGVILNGSNWFNLPTNLLPVIAKSYSASVWLKTTQISGNDGDQAFSDAGILWADVPGEADDSIPMALTGHKLGFFTGDPDSTLHSTNNIDTGSYVHLVVTRDQITGTRKIYINGNLDSTDTAGTQDLNASTELDLGMNVGSFIGVHCTLDDFQLYSGVLTAAQVAYLHAHPEVAAPLNVSNNTPVTLLNPAMNGSNFKFSFLSVNGATHLVQYNTNLTAGVGWQTQSTVNGDGSSKNVSVPIPINGASSAFFRVTTQ